MKIHHQSIPDRQKLGELIADFDIAMLTFINTQGLLVSQPMAPIEMDSNGVIWFFSECDSEKMGHLQTLNLSFSGEPDSSYISLSGHGEIEKSPTLKHALWSPFVKPWFPEGADSPSLCLLKFVPHLAEYWDAPHSKVVRLFAMITSIAASKPIGLGEHAHLNHL